MFKFGHALVTLNPPWSSVHNFTEEAHAHNYGKGRHALNCQQGSIERAAQEREQAARDEVHVAVARATEMSGAELLARMNALEQRAEQSWTSHQVALLDEANSVAGDALELQRSNLLSEANSGHQKTSERESTSSSRVSARRSTPLVRSLETTFEVSNLREEKKWEFETSIEFLLKRQIFSICMQQADLVRPKVHHKFTSYRNAGCRTSEVECSTS